MIAVGMLTVFTMMLYVSENYKFSFFNKEEVRYDVVKNVRHSNSQDRNTDELTLSVVAMAMKRINLAHVRPAKVSSSLGKEVRYVAGDTRKRRERPGDLIKVKVDSGSSDANPVVRSKNNASGVAKKSVIITKDGRGTAAATFSESIKEGKIIPSSLLRIQNASLFNEMSIKTPFNNSEQNQQTLALACSDPEICPFRQRELSHRDREILLDILRVFIRVAEENDWTYFIVGGTLIGSFRHHGFIPWDDDIDVMLNKSHTAAVKEAFIEDANYFVHDRGDDPILKLFSSYSYKCPKKACKWKWPFVDLIFFEEDYYDLWNTNPVFSSVKHRKTDVFPLLLRPFEGLMVKAPRSTIAWIDVCYGVSDICQTWDYNHSKEEAGQTVVKINCQRLNNIYPFVFRHWTNGMMEETLKLGEEVLDVKLVKEPRSAVTVPYSTVPIGWLKWRARVTAILWVSFAILLPLLVFLVSKIVHVVIIPALARI
jgi:hypothetical protein